MIESNSMGKIENKMDIAHLLAKKFELEIKEVLATKYSLPPDDLVLLLKDEAGAYFDDADPHILCTLVLGQKAGYIYLVTAKIEGDGQSLSDFKSDIVA